MADEDNKMKLVGCMLALVPLIALTSSVACGFACGAGVGFGVFALWLVFMLALLLAVFKKTVDNEHEEARK